MTKILNSPPYLGNRKKGHHYRMNNHGFDLNHFVIVGVFAFGFRLKLPGSFGHLVIRFWHFFGIWNLLFVILNLKPVRSGARLIGYGLTGLGIDRLINEELKFVQVNG